MRLRGILTLLLVTVIWGTTFPVQKLVIGDVSPTTYISVRFAMATLLSYLLWGKGDWKRGGILGIILALSYTSQTMGLRFTTASKNGFYTSLYVVLVPLVSWLIEREKLRLNHAIGITMAFLGSYLLSGGIGGFNLGDFLSLLCGVGFAFHVVLITVFSKQVKETNLLTPQFAITSIANLIISRSHELTLPSLGVAAYTAVMATVLGIWAQVKYQKVIGSNTAALVFAGEPVFSALFAYIMLGETLTPVQIAGAAILTGAIILAGVRT